MKQFSLLGLLFSLALPFSLYGQIMVTGQVVDGSTGEGLSYATISRANADGGTLANLDGGFRLAVDRLTDTLVISFIGYDTRSIVAADIRKQSTIALQSTSVELAELTVYANDDYLYEALANCGKTLNGNQLRQSKTYFQVISRTKDQPIEMIQAYYNAELNKGGLATLGLKNGRVALARASQDSLFFVSLGTTQALSRLNLRKGNQNFPEGPLSLNLKQIRRNYSLQRLASLSAPDQYHIAFTPRRKEAQYFSGEVWLDKTDFTLHKIILRQENMQLHPFRPIWLGSRMENLNLELTFTFRQENGASTLSHINWEYDFLLYQKVENAQYGKPIFSEGVLHCYDYTDHFFLPLFNYAEEHNDYRKISFLPHNPDFWQRAHGLVFTENQRRQLSFFRENGVLLNYFSSNNGEAAGFFEENNPIWTAEFRISMPKPKPRPANRQSDKPRMQDLTSFRTPGSNNQPDIDIVVQIFLDANPQETETQYVSQTVLDAFQTYYDYPIDEFTNCYLNIYFDLCEMERRRMMEELNDLPPFPTEEAITNVYEDATARIENLKRKYFSEVQEGRNEEALYKWNRVVYDALGLDNIAMFKLQKPEVVQE